MAEWLTKKLGKVPKILLKIKCRIAPVAKRQFSLGIPCAQSGEFNYSSSTIITRSCNKVARFFLTIGSWRSPGRLHWLKYIEEFSCISTRALQYKFAAKLCGNILFSCVDLQQIIKFKCVCSDRQLTSTMSCSWANAVSFCCTFVRT